MVLPAAAKKRGVPGALAGADSMTGARPAAGKETRKKGTKKRAVPLCMALPLKHEKCYCPGFPKACVMISYCRGVRYQSRLL